MGIVLQNAVDFIARYGRFMQRPSQSAVGDADRYCLYLPVRWYGVSCSRAFSLVITMNESIISNAHRVINLHLHQHFPTPTRLFAATLPP